MNSKQLIKDIKTEAMKLKRTKLTDNKLLLVPSGSVMLNLACSENYRGAFPIGKIVNLIGDSSSGKTLLALTMFAQMSLMPEFDEYEFIYDDVEQACEFDIVKLFGKKTAERIIAPAYDEEGEPVYSDTIQDFHLRLKERLDKGKRFIWVEDSFDALTSKEEQVSVNKELEAYKKNTKASGSYDMQKPKIASKILRTIKSDLANTESFLLIISQTRDNIDPFSFEKRTRSGGKALKFYSSHEIWLAVTGKEKSRDRVVGVDVKAKVSKNKLTGKYRTVEFPVFYDYGVDDLSSILDFMTKEGFWKKTKQTIEATELNFSGTAGSLIKHIEENNLEEEVYEIIKRGWLEIEDSLKINRKSKF